jgi:hypothetical protein
MSAPIVVIAVAGAERVHNAGDVIQVEQRLAARQRTGGFGLLPVLLLLRRLRSTTRSSARVITSVGCPTHASRSNLVATKAQKPEISPAGQESE